MSEGEWTLGKICKALSEDLRPEGQGTKALKKRSVVIGKYLGAMEGGSGFK